MRKKVVLILTAIFLLTCVTGGVYASQQYMAYQDKLAKQEKSAALLNTVMAEKDTAKPIISKEQISSRINHIQNDFDIRQYLQEKGYYEDDIQIILKKYIDASVLYNMTDAESAYLTALCDTGYDFEKLLDIYCFLQAADNPDMSLVKLIYNIAKDDFGAKFWLENAYAKVIGQDDALTMEEMLQYTDSGISLEEIVLVYEMSLRQNKTEREMLTARVNGQSWVQIASEAYNDPNMLTQFSADTTLSDIMTFATISKIVSQKPSDTVAAPLELTPSAEAIYTEKQERVRQLRAEFCDDSAVLTAAKAELQQLDEATVTQLIEEGFRIKEIKTALETNTAQTESPRLQSIHKIMNTTEKEGALQ